MPAFDKYGNPTPWKQANWRERITLVLFWAFMWGVIFPAMLLGFFLVFGMIMEGITWQDEALRICQKHATTPYEYHQCR